MAIVDLSQRTPLFARLSLKYEDISRGLKLATVVYSSQISPIVLYQQINLYNDGSLCLNQDLFVCILEIMLDNLYVDILAKFINFPYTRELLYMNNVRELLNDMKLIFMKEEEMLCEVQGRNIWNTGY